MIGDPALRLRRLERLRALDGRIVSAAELPAPPPRPVAADHPSGDGAARLAEALGGRVETRDEGTLVVVERRLPFPFDPAPLDTLPFPVDAARPLVLLDTETTGLGTAAGTVAFLVGLGRWEGEALILRQFWLPDHPDEPAFLAALAAALPSDAWLVTYNGRGFDWPLLVARFRIHARPPPTLAGHLDLLPVARQLWRHRLSDARLGTVEAGVAGLRRQGDLAGALVPERYFAVLRGGPARLLEAVAEHNRADLVAMAHLLRVLAGRLADPAYLRIAHPGDVAGLGRAFGRAGRHREAAACLTAALEAYDRAEGPSIFDRDGLAFERARALARAGQHPAARMAWGEVAARGGATAISAWIALAKDLEHRRRDIPGALTAAERAAALLTRRRAMGRFLPEAERDLPRRIGRLRRRLARSAAA